MLPAMTWGLVANLCWNDASMSAHKLLRLHHAADLPPIAASMGVLGKYLPRISLEMPSGVDGTYPARIAAQQRAELRPGSSLVLMTIAPDSGFKPCGHVHRIRCRRLIYHHHVVRLIDVGMNGAALRR